MEKCLTWYVLSLKLYIKKKMYYFQLLTMFVVVFLVYKIQLPDFDTVTVGVSCEESLMGEDIFKNLEKTKGVFRYQRSEDREQLKQDVLAGRLEAGMIFTEAFDKGMETGKNSDTVLLYTTPFSVKSEVLKETVYTEIFPYISDLLLQQIDEEIYGHTDEERLERLSQLNHWYLDSDALFKLEIMEVPVETQQASDTDITLDTPVYPVQGTVGLFLFFILYLAYSKKWEESSRGLLKALTKRNQSLYMSMQLIASATIPAALGLLAINGMDVSRGFGKECILMLLFIVMTVVWLDLLGKLLKDYMTYLGCGLAILLANIFLCPVFLDISSMIPSVRYIRLLFPLGWYFLF